MTRARAQSGSGDTGPAPVDSAIRLSRRWPVAIVLGAGIALSIVAYGLTDRLDRAAERSRFEKEATVVFEQIHFRVESTLAVVRSIAGLFAASESVDRRQFNVFVNSLGALPAVQALEWIPRVPHAQRPAFEEAARRDGHPDFAVTERQAQGTMVPAGDRAEYFPVFYVEPLAGNEAALGFDLGSNAARRKALDRARDSGQMVATHRITLVQESGQQYGFLVFVPAYGNRARRLTVESRRENLLGFGLGVFRMGDIIEAALSMTPAGTRLVEVRVEDRSDPDDHQLLYPSGGEANPPAAKLAGLQASHDWIIGGRDWTITATPSPAFQAEFAFHWQAWLVLAVGLAFTGIAALYVNQLLGRSRSSERLIDERTAELADSEARTAAVVDTVLDAIITIEPDGTVRSYNRAAVTTFGYSVDEVLGRNVKMLMPAPFHGEHDQYLENYTTTGVAKILGIGREVVGRRKDGSEFPMDLAVGEMRVGDQRMFVGICRDITERKQAERQILDRTAQLEAANTELDSFAYSVSHDLRAPLRAMGGFSRALEEDYGDRLDGDARNYLSRISAASRRMGQMIDDILVLSRATRGEMELSNVDLSKIAETILNQLREAAPDRKVEAHIAPGVTARGDPRLLRIVLENLLGNAWKFTGKKDSADIQFGVERADGETVYSVRDNGAGFDMAYSNKLFGIFQRLHSITDFEGTGIGLATVSRLIHRHGGRVWAEAKVDVGATFHFTLGSD